MVITDLGMPQINASLEVSMRTFHLLVLLFSLAGCVPMPYTYYALENSSGSTNRTEKCSGPFTEIRIPFNGIFIHANIGVSERQNWFIAFEIPQGYEAKLLSDILLVESPTEDKSYVRLIPKWDYWSYNNIKMKTTDPFSRMIGYTTNLGSDLFGRTALNHRRFYYFPTQQPVNTKADRGILKLPDIEINGKPLSGLSIPFNRKSDFTFDALNC